MRRILVLVALVVAVCAAPLRPAFARPTVSELAQPILVQLDLRIAALADATSRTAKRVKAKLVSARLVVLLVKSATNDLSALKYLGVGAARVAAALPSDPDFPILFDTALAGFDGVITVTRNDAAAAVGRIAGPVARAKATKSLEKLDAAIATARRPALLPLVRARNLAAAFTSANALAKSLSSCPGHPGAYGHGQFSSLVDDKLFAPANATAELIVNAAGEPQSLAIDGFRYPYALGAVYLSVPKHEHGFTTGFVYDNGSGALGGTYSESGVSYFMDAGTLTFTEFDQAKRRIAGYFEFTTRDFVGGAARVVRSGTFTICGFKATVR